MNSAVISQEEVSLFSDSYQITSESSADPEIPPTMAVELDLVQSDDIETIWGNSRKWARLEAESETKVIEEPQIKTPLIRLPPGTLPVANVEVLQQWEGVVTSVSDSTFFADLQDLNDSTNPIEVVELPLSEIPDDDRQLVAEGAVFYWSIGYEHGSGGQIRRISEIRMKRLPTWTKRSIKLVEKQGVELFELYGR